MLRQQDPYLSHINYTVHQKFLFGFYLVLLSPVLGISGYIVIHFNEVDAIQFPAILFILGCIVFSWFLSKKAAHHIVFDGMSFKCAAIFSFLYYISLLQFLPFAGVIADWTEELRYKNPHVQNPRKIKEERK